MTSTALGLFVMSESSPRMLWHLLLFAGWRIAHLEQIGVSSSQACVKQHLRITDYPVPFLLSFS